MFPKISVIIPSYNRAHIIKDTLDSIISQSYQNWECLIIDDISNDNTENIINTYVQKDSRFKFIKRPAKMRKGASTCRNIGLKIASGSYVQFLDSDDMLASNKFEVQIKALENSAANAIASCKWGGVRLKKENANIYHGLPTYFSTPNPLKLIEVYGNRFTFLPSHVFLIPMSVLFKSGKWEESLTVNDDGEFFSRIILNSSEVVFCEDTFVLYRSGAGDRLSGSIHTENGIKSYIKSLELIDKNIQKSAGILNHTYVRQRKTELYHKLKRRRPQSIDQNSIFFKHRSPNLFYFFCRFTSGLKNKVYRKVENIEFKNLQL